MVFPNLNEEIKLWNQGCRFVCGLDEVGRGCFAGPVVVGAVIFPQDIVSPDGLADSKLLSPKKREKLSKLIKESALAWAIAEVDVDFINTNGIGQAAQEAFRQAVVLINKKTQIDFCLIDAFYITGFNRQFQKPVKDGDKLCASISAASIIAKVYRDELMVGLHEQYPEYGFAKHKGYGTNEHRDAIKKHGLCKIHRTSFNLNKFL